MTIKQAVKMLNRDFILPETQVRMIFKFINSRFQLDFVTSELARILEIILKGYDVQTPISDEELKDVVLIGMSDFLTRVNQSY